MNGLLNRLSNSTELAYATGETLMLSDAARSAWRLDPRDAVPLRIYRLRPACTDQKSFQDEKSEARDQWSQLPDQLLCSIPSSRESSTCCADTKRRVVGLPPYLFAHSVVPPRCG